MPSVLAAPVDFSVSDARYGKSYNLLQNLETEEYDITAYTGRIDSQVACKNVDVISLGSSSKIDYMASSYRTIYREIQRENFDLYHHMNLGYRWFNPLLVAGVLDDIPTLIGPAQGGHEIYPQEFNHLIQNILQLNVPEWITDPTYQAVKLGQSTVIDPLRTRLYERTLRKADKIIAVHKEAEDLLSRFVDRSKIEVIPLGVDPNDFKFSERRRTNDLVSIGALKKRKGYDVLLHSLRAVQEEFPNVHLHVFGTGPLESELKEQAMENGVRSNVTFHGYVNQSVLKEYLRDAQAFVHPSRSESFSLVRLEAMSTGTPAIVSDTSGAKEMVREGEDGYVVPVENQKSLAEAIKRILSDFELVQEMGRNARNHVEEKYDWRKIGREYVETYNSLL